MRDKGFTLVETLFALVAGGLLLAGLSAAVGGLEDRYRRARADTPAERVETVANVLERTVAHAYPPARGAVLAGTTDQLGLLVPPPAALGAIGPVRLLLAVVGTPGNRALVATFVPDQPDQPLPAVARRADVLASGFRDIRISYLRRAGDGLDRLPRLVTFNFVSADGTELPVGVEPRLAFGADCVFDPISLTCRS